MCSTMGWLGIVGPTHAVNNISWSLFRRTLSPSGERDRERNMFTPARVLCRVDDNLARKRSQSRRAGVGTSARRSAKAGRVIGHRLDLLVGHFRGDRAHRSIGIVRPAAGPKGLQLIFGVLGVLPRESGELRGNAG